MVIIKETNHDKLVENRIKMMTNGAGKLFVD